MSVAKYDKRSRRCCSANQLGASNTVSSAYATMLKNLTTVLCYSLFDEMTSAIR